MKPQPIFIFLVMTCLLAACQTETTPTPARTTVANELALAPDQSATVPGTDLTITFHSVVSDERCPSEVECVVSGPVTVSLSVQQGENAPSDFTLQTFTDLNGRSPNVQFEGVTNRTEVGDYVVQLASVTPYPKNSTTKISASAYRVGLLVSNK